MADRRRGILGRVDDGVAPGNGVEYSLMRFRRSGKVGGGAKLDSPTVAVLYKVQPYYTAFHTALPTP